MFRSCYRHRDPREQNGTCAHHTSEDPALAVLDWTAVVLVPLLEDANAAGPVGGPHSIIVAANPASL